MPLLDLLGEFAKRSGGTTPYQLLQAQLGRPALLHTANCTEVLMRGSSGVGSRQTPRGLTHTVLIMLQQHPPRAAAHAATASGATGPQRIPRRIVQTGRSFSHAMATHATHMRAWWELNPEYRYRFFDDEQAARFVRQRGSADEQLAYRALITGAQKADVFRLLALKYDGGVYADVDSELRAPLSSVIPRGASAVVGRFWTSEFMAYEPQHPILVEAARRVASGVLQQLRWLQALALNGTDHSQRCRSPHSCVLKVTGPPVYMDAAATLAERLGCTSRGRLPAQRDCRHAVPRFLWSA